MWEGVITFIPLEIYQFISSQGGEVNVYRKLCQLMERCDAHGRSVQELGEV